MIKKANPAICLALTITILGALSEKSAADVIYVDANATAGANDGSRWADAYISLQDALDAAVYGDEIHVAEGAYKPDPTGLADPREATFQLVNGVVLYGGYAGFSTPIPDTRDPNLYLTILSGDLAGDDVEVVNSADLLDETTRQENSFHVVTVSYSDPNTHLDGFTITGGNANSNNSNMWDPDNWAGGMYNYSSSPTLTKCNFNSNSASFAGGAMLNYTDSNPNLVDCTFTKNYSNVWAGALANHTNSNATLYNCLFSYNSANYGGGMYNYNSKVTLNNCTFNTNSATLDGGGMNNNQCSPILTDCSFSGNSAYFGGGMLNYFDCSPTLNNCVFNDNSAAYGGGMRSITNCNPTLNNCTFFDNTAFESAGGIQNYESNSTLYDCAFINNKAYDAGGMLNYENCEITLNNCTFIGNSADDHGGGMYNYLSTVAMIDCSFNTNSASKYGGGAYNASCTITVTDCFFNINSAFRGGGTFNEGSDFAITGSTFTKNYAFKEEYGYGYGGGMCNDNGVSDTSFTITRCILDENWATSHGGGMYNAHYWYSSAEISNCIFTGNRARSSATNIGFGGGMYNTHSWGPGLLIANCTFSGNSASNGGGILSYDHCNLTLINCTFTGNSANNGKSLACDANWEPKSNIEIDNCILWDSEDQIWNSDGSTITIMNSDVQGGFPGLGNIDVVPEFVDQGYWDSNGTLDDPNDDAWIDGDYHLKSKAGHWDPISQSLVYDTVTSRCIDAGNPGSFLGDEPLQANNLRINMGAYGGTIEASRTPVDWSLLADLTNDGIVNLADSTHQAKDWAKTAAEQPGDLNRDGVVDILDLSHLCQDWLIQTIWHKSTNRRLK